MADPTASAASILHWVRVTARGPESETFLQGQLSQDVVATTDANWSALLAPDSTVVTSGLLSRVAEGFDFVVPRASGEETVARLRRFLLRARCALDLEETDAGPLTTLGERVAAGWPGPSEYAAQLTPHSFGRHFVETTISFQKGCFTGQELVGRLDARGSSVPWRLVRVEGPSRAAIDDVLRARGPSGPQGVTSVLEDAERVVGLGVAHRTLLASDTGDVVVVEVP